MISPVDFADIKVLVVDDEDFTRSMIRRLLSLIGVANVHEAADGANALTKLDELKPDIVILDIMMEPMNGLKFLKTVRSGLSGVDIGLPVIVLTGSADEAVLGTAMALDCDAFVRKNEGPDIIRSRMERVLSAPRQVREPENYHGVRIPDLSITVAAEARPDDVGPPPSDARQVALGEVEVGAVLAKDLRTGDGHLLLASGVEITASFLHRLSDINEFMLVPDPWVQSN